MVVFFGLGLIGLVGGIVFYVLSLRLCLNEFGMRISKPKGVFVLSSLLFLVLYSFQYADKFVWLDEHGDDELGVVEEVSSVSAGGDGFESAVLGETSELVDTTGGFEKVSVLEDYASGYRMVYPAGFLIDYETAGKVEIQPPSKQGAVLVYVKGENLFEVRVIDEGVSDADKIVLMETASLVRDTFQFITDSGINPTSIERFR